MRKDEPVAEVPFRDKNLSKVISTVPERPEPFSLHTNFIFLLSFSMILLVEILFVQTQVVNFLTKFCLLT